MDPHGDMAATFRLGDFELDRHSRTLRHQGRAIPLGARALDLLWALVAARGQLVTKDELLRQAWPGLVVEEANVQVQVSALRKVLGADAIATVPSLGYRLALSIHEGGGVPIHHNLGSERTPFVGRSVALAEAQDRLTHGVLLTLIGIGGSGKTRLARRLAELELNRFADGVWWIDLAPLDRAEQLAPALAQVVGCRLTGKDLPMVALGRALRTRRMLLVLDNCEHLVDAACAMLDSLLDIAPDLRVIATSREALGLRGEMILPVKPLETPPPDATPEQVWRSEAVCLFLQAAELACPHLPFSDDAAPTVAAICRQLDGIPLALELAAAQLQVIGPDQLLAVLQQRFRLALGARRLLPRQQTLHAVIRWSVDNLGQQERQVLSALVACAGGCDLEAVHTLMGQAPGDSPTISSLARLADRSLITVQHVAGLARYHLLETVRQYVLEALMKEDVEATLQDRHCAHYLQLAETYRPKLAQSARARTLSLLDLERENMGRAIDWAVRKRQWMHGARLVHALLPHWTARSWLLPGFELAEAVLAVADPEEDRLLANVLMVDAANLALRMGRYDVAEALSLRALFEAQQAGSLEHEIDALVMRTYGQLLGRGPAETVYELEGMLERAVRAGLAVQQSHLLSALGQARMEMGDFQSARDALERARRIYEDLGNPTGAAMETINLAFLAVCSNDSACARRLLAEHSQHHPQLDHHVYACFTIFTFACLAGLEEQWARCVRAHLAALRHFESGGVADSRLRKRQREHDLHRARQALDAATLAAAEREGATGLIGADLEWAFVGAEP